jgi:hypothetical protein
MSRRVAVSTMLATAGLFTAATVSGQARPLDPKGVEVFNRSVSGFTDGARTGLRLSASAGDGVAYLPGVEFGNGTIELDVKGKDVQGQSFVGVAFHGVDGTTYDAIYFRPFNFRTEDAARHLRAVQYISHPAYPWQKLRAEHPGQYEKPVSPAPDPNAWFHVRVVVAAPNVSVFVDDAKQPSLVVSQLTERRKGRVGLWVGNGSDGDFANVKIVAKE